MRSTDFVSTEAAFQASRAKAKKEGEPHEIADGTLRMT
jgi:hypothetical protein